MFHYNHIDESSIDDSSTAETQPLTTQRAGNRPCLIFSYESGEDDEIYAEMGSHKPDVAVRAQTNIDDAIVASIQREHCTLLVMVDQVKLQY